jgi:hypothetical protein
MAYYNDHHVHNPKTTYLAIAGDYDPGNFFNDTLRWTLTTFIVGRGDFVVPVWSVHALPYTANRTVSSSYPDRGADHLNMHQYLPFFTQALSSITAPGSNRMLLSSAASVPGIERTATIPGRVAPGATASHILPIDSPSRAAFLLFSSSGDLTFTLIDPTGAAVIPGASVSFERSPTLGGWMYSYGFDGPIATGTWTAQIVSGATAPADYWMNAWLEGTSIALTAETAPVAAPVGSAITIRASLQDGGIPMSAASVDASIAQPGLAAITQIVLRDDGAGADDAAGDGVYSGLFEDTAVAGAYGVVVTASAQPPAAAFSREAYTQFAISQSRSSLPGGISDSGRDTNGNGRFDHLVVTVPVDATHAGRYVLVGTLHDQFGQELTASAEAVLTPGLHELELLFDGALIFRNAVDGPYSLVSLRLAEDLNGQILPVVEQQPAYQTTAYRYTQFEGGGLALTGSNSAEGIDLNANGRFDLLRTRIGIAVEAPGFYEVSARLRDRNGREITLGRTQGSLSAGNATLTIDFDGRAIGQNGVDGPYAITDLLLIGPGVTLSVANVFTTQVFAASSFEGYVASAGPPRLTGTIASITRESPTQIAVQLRLTNTGAGVARNVLIQSVTPKVLTGPASPSTTLVSPALPIVAGDLNPNASVNVRLVFSVPAGVRRIQLTETGTVIDGSGAVGAFAVAQSAIVP